MCRLIPSCPYCRTITAGLSLEPRLLDVPTKQAWLSWSLSEEVDGAGAEQLELVCRRDNMLQGLCGMLGADEATGERLTGEDGP